VLDEKKNQKFERGKIIFWFREIERKYIV